MEPIDSITRMVDMMAIVDCLLVPEQHELTRGCMLVFSPSIRLRMTDRKMKTFNHDNPVILLDARSDDKFDRTVYTVLDRHGVWRFSFAYDPCFQKLRNAVKLIAR